MKAILHPVSFAAPVLLLAMIAPGASGQGGAAPQTGSREPVLDARATRARTNQEGANFQPPSDRASWLRRRQALREQILVSCGLWPMPERIPLKPQVYGRLNRDGYTIEKVVLETLPGFYLTGNLYRPLGKPGRLAGVLCPHGHWATGRFEEQIQARGIGVARLGAVAFVYDMVGYGDSKPFGHTFTNDALVLNGFSLTTLQLWNSMRALDFLSGLPDVDPNRIACTGESGGGTQTFLLSAVDDRVQLAAPVCMVSHTFQGGCECENSPGLRLDTDNVEFAAMVAPKPQILIAATGDWTSKLMTNGYPELRATYRLFGQENSVRASIFTAPHNYNQASREAVYAFLGLRLMGMATGAAPKETAYKIETAETISCWDAQHPRPATAARPADVQKILTEIAGRQLAALAPQSAAQWQAARKVLRTGLRASLGAAPVSPGELLVEDNGVFSAPGAEVRRLVLGRVGRGDRIPAMYLTPAGRKPEYGVVLVHPAGKAALLDAAGQPGPLVAGLLHEGLAVLAIDLFLTGDHLRPGEEPRRATAVHTLTYNRSTPAERVQDILTAVAALRVQPGIQGVHLAGIGSAGTLCILARALTDQVSRLAADTNQFEFSLALSRNDPAFSPGLVRYGGVRLAAALGAPRKTFLHNTGTVVDATSCRKAFELEGAPGDLVVSDKPAPVAEIVAWLAQ